jgi:hypothetical protein
MASHRVSFVITTLGFAALVACVPVAQIQANTIIYSWDASSGLFPDQISADCTLYTNGTTPTQVLSAGVLTLQNDQVPGVHPYNYYVLANSAIAAGVPFMIDATMRLVSETNPTDSRDAAGIDIEFPVPGGGMIQTLEIGPNRIFMLCPDTNHRGDTATVVTTDGMHHYHIDVSANGVVSASFDGVPKVSEPMIYNADGTNWPHAILFGNDTNQVSGVSEWQSFMVTVVPEPPILILLGICLASLLAYAWRWRTRMA